MKIYIPDHLYKLNIFDQLAKLIVEYSKNHYEIIYDSFSDYNESLKIDPVKKFLDLIVTQESLGENQEKESVVNYLSRLFYSVKGTLKIFEYMENYLKILSIKDINYTTNYLEIKLSSDLVLLNESQFITLFKDFLNELLYFQNIEINVDSINLSLKGDINTYLGTNLSSYKKYTVTIEYEDYNNKK